MLTIKRLIVDALEWACGRLDSIPRYSFAERRWYRGGCWGCHPLRLSRAALLLDDRWDTGHWGEGRSTSGQDFLDSEDTVPGREEDDHHEQ